MSTNAYRDENGVPTLISVLNTDGRTIGRILADPTTHRLNISNGTTGTNHGPTNGARDENGVVAFMAVSSVDGFTPVVVYRDSNGNLLTQSS